MEDVQVHLLKKNIFLCPMLLLVFVLLFTISTLVLKSTSLSITCRIMGMKEVTNLSITSNVLDRSSIVSLCQSLSDLYEYGEIQTCVSIENLVNVKVTDCTDFVPTNILVQNTGVTTFSHVYHSSNFNFNLEKRLNDFVDKSDADSAASKKRFDDYVEKSDAELALVKNQFDVYVDKSDAELALVNAESTASKTQFNVYVDKSDAELALVNAELTASKTQFDVVAANYTILHKKLLGLSSERGTCRIIDNVYAAIHSELKRTGQFTEYANLSSLLSSKSIDKSARTAAITKALSTISGLPSAGPYWDALRDTKIKRIERQHAELQSQEEAFEIVEDFLKPTRKRMWPPSPATNLKKILLTMIPLMYKSKNEAL